jgi:hypothetical protein
MHKTGFFGIRRGKGVIVVRHAVTGIRSPNILHLIPLPWQFTMNQAGKDSDARTMPERKAQEHIFPYFTASPREPF